MRPLWCVIHKEGAAPTWKHSFGYYPMSCSWTTPAPLWRRCCARVGAWSNTAADHIAVLDQAPAQIPDAHRYGSELVRTDSAGCTHGLRRVPALRRTESELHLARESVR
jgi:hypothetical protein